jgi:hypothetical protein
MVSARNDVRKKSREDFEKMAFKLCIGPRREGNFRKA